MAPSNQFEKLFSSPDEVLHSNDIALLKVKRKNEGSAAIIFSDHVLPACLPQDHTSHQADTQCTISGWGQVDGKIFFFWFPNSKRLKGS